MKKPDYRIRQLNKIRHFLKILLFLMLILLLQGFRGYSIAAADTLGGGQQVESISDLDLGDYSSTMSVGEKQLLSVTILPQTAATQTVTFASNNDSVATINGLGRITAVSIGKAKITASCGSVSRSFELTVKETSTSTKTINVTDIELEDYAKELAVDKTLSLSATVLPTDATDSKLSYSSSNTEIATVSSSGVVKGISPGNVDISISAGGFSKKISLAIKVFTASIQMNTNYLVLKRGDSFQLSGKALPVLAKQEFSFQSQDESIATVTQLGNVTAKSVGNTTILVTNGDLSVAVTAIINESNIAEESEIKAALYSNSNEEDTSVAFSKLLSQNEVVMIQANDYPLVSSSMLKQLYESKNMLKIQGEGYTLELNGKSIVNYNNQITTKLDIIGVKSGIKVAINSEASLPGEMMLQLEQGKSYKYLYLYNSAKEKYERINVNDLSNVKIEIAGTYLFTKHKLNGLSVSLYLIAGFVTVVVIFAGIYVIVKKKHWFW